MSSPRTVRKLRNSSRPVIEAMEARQMLAATAGVSNGVLNIEGTPEYDQFVITSDGATITVKHNTRVLNTFSTVGVTSIRVNCHAGDDEVFIRPDGDDHPGTIVGAEINGGAGKDTLHGGSGNDIIRGGDNDDFLSGHAGNDVIDGGAGADKFFGGNGIDRADYGSRTANLTITLDGNANDGQAGENDDVKDTVEDVTCGSGHDNVSSPASKNIVNNFFGGDGNDVLSGGGGSDGLDGWNGHDSVFGGEGDDVLWGWTGVDDLNGEGGNDQMYGEDNGDFLDGGLGADIFSGGDGDDVADYTARTENLRISLDNVANDGVPGGLPYRDPVTGRWYVNRGEQDNVRNDVEVVWGGSGSDTITSPSTDTTTNIFIGNGGNDYLDAGGGADWMFGGQGNDTLIGNDGAWDYLYGNEGTDLVRADPTDIQADNEGVYTPSPFILWL